MRDEEQPMAIDQESSTMATVPSARERRTSSTVGKRPVARARRGERSQRLAGLLKLVSQSTRLRILLALADGPKSTGQLSKQLGQGELIVNYHLALLRASKVVDSRHVGYEALYQLTKSGSRFLDSALGLLNEEDAVPEPRISPSELKKLIKKVSTVIDDPEEWLNTPNPQFEGRRPIDLIGTDDEIRVHIIIGAAQQGFFS
jgi:DNA-binding transcriptional ArsR family regulator